ncbi:MAG TPA: WD40 repeat domain-containing serine/threonine-protein kinase [Isosphaeraceae bacterium]|jgi:serine/threonine protein kinase/WD40 repeat protein|nr:WD40 repeat domain-containing serine/threonine-protein kinase [Isosphaeraceae bacterium]
MMIRRFETDPVDRDERLGEAIEAFLAKAESGAPPDPDQFVAEYPDLGEDLRAALEGLALVRGLVGDASGPGHRLEAGRRIAGYRIVRELGRGGMGIVYEAVHVDLDRPVALKVLGTQAAPDSTGRRRFLNEARTAAGLHHTHIVPVFDVGQVGGLCYYAMQRIEGSGLDRVLRTLRRGRSTAAGSGAGMTAAHTTPLATSGNAESPPGLPSLPEETATWIGGAGRSSSGHVGTSLGPAHNEPPPFEPPHGTAYYRWVARAGRQAAEALAHAHHRGIIHRDIKPSNLLVDARGTIWVADFGLARRMADPNLTQSDSLLGTPRYMSPEQATNGAIDGRTDLYSLGATLYELLTLRPPFEGRTHAELNKQITTKEPATPRQFDAKIPRDLETIVLKAMAKRPADRYTSAGELAEDLGRFLSYEPVKARRIGPVGQLWRFAQRHPSITAVTTVAAATVLAVATVSYVRIMNERDRARTALHNEEAANDKAQSALRKYEESSQNEQASRRKELLSTATVTRKSSEPNRRDLGLDLLKRAALGSDTALRLKLRAEAVEFMALRQVEERKAEIPTGRTRNILFGAGESRLATLSEDGGEFRLWDVARHELRAGPLKTGPESAIDRSPNNRRSPGSPGMAAVGHHIAVIWPDGRGIRLFDASTGAQFADVPTGDREIVGLYAVPGEQPRLVTVERIVAPKAKTEESTTSAGGASAEGAASKNRGRDNRRDYVGLRVNLWDPANKNTDGPVKTLTETSTVEFGTFPLVAIDPDGQTIATGWTRSTPVSLWSASNGEPRGEPIDTQVSLTALALGPDGLLAAAGGGQIRLWEVESRGPLPSLNIQGTARSLRFSPDGSLLAVAGGWREAGVELWDPAGTALVAALPTTVPVSDVAFSPKGQTLAIGQTAFPSATSSSVGQSSVAIWNILEPMGQVRFSGFREVPSSLAFSSTGLFAMASRAGELRFWCPDRCPSSSYALEGVGSSSMTFDVEGRMVALDSDKVRWYEPPSSDCVHQIALPEPPANWPGMRKGGPTSRPAPPTAIARTADGRILALARSSDVLIYSADKPDDLQRLSFPQRAGRERKQGGFGPPPLRPCRELALAPGGDRLYLTSFVDEFSAWVLEGKMAQPLDWSIPSDGITALALSPDGKRLALGHDGAVLLVDTAKGSVLTRLSSPSDEDDGEIRSLAFAPNGGELAVGTRRGTIRIWKLDGTPEPLLRLPGHRGLVTTLAYDSTGYRLASGGVDKAVVVWDLNRVSNELKKLGLGW